MMEGAYRRQNPSSMVLETNEWDVFLGRGKSTQHRPGNTFLRKLAMEKAMEHLDVRGDKTVLAAQIVFSIQTKGGRFLRSITEINSQGETIEAWEIVNNEMALTKAKQAIRDATQTLRKSTNTRKRKTPEGSKPVKSNCSLPSEAMQINSSQSPREESTLESSRPVLQTEATLEQLLSDRGLGFSQQIVAPVRDQSSSSILPPSVPLTGATPSTYAGQLLALQREIDLQRMQQQRLLIQLTLDQRSREMLLNPTPSLLSQSLRPIGNVDDHQLRYQILLQQQQQQQQQALVDPRQPFLSSLYATLPTNQNVTLQPQFPAALYATLPSHQNVALQQQEFRISASQPTLDNTGLPLGRLEQTGTAAAAVGEVLRTESQASSNSNSSASNLEQKPRARSPESKIETDDDDNAGHSQLRH